MERGLAIALITVMATITVFAVQAGACGCGIALANPKIFNNLKESEAYLITKINGNGSFSMSPYFQFVSLGDQYNVTMVFPLKAVPQGVNATMPSLGDFLSGSGISQFQSDRQNQSVSGLAQNMRPYGYLGTVLYGTGLLGSTVAGVLFGLYSLLGLFGGAGMAGGGPGGVGGALGHGGGAVASFTFNGGTLDVYNASSANTLAQVVQSKGIQYNGTLAQLVKKYSSYYVAVLQIRVPSVLPPSQMHEMQTICLADYNLTKQLLKNGGNITYGEIGPTATYPDYRMAYLIKNDMAAGANDSGIFLSSNYNASSPFCSTLAWIMVDGATGGNTAPNGILLTMNFKSGDTIFYPVSVVNSYQYPVSHQDYFVEAPLSKDLSFVSSGAPNITVSQGSRWYQVGGTQQDLEVRPVAAGALRLAQDQALLYVALLNQNTPLIFGMAYLAVLAFMLHSLNQRRRRVKGVSLVSLVAFGAVYFAYKTWKADRALAQLALLTMCIFVLMAVV